jgi:fructose-1,6-bisphosphatase/inositol monophosphatase family enzyme
VSDFDIMALATILRDAAKAEVVPRFRRLDRSAIRQKSEAIDLVTDADVAAERLIRARAAEVWPEALFVGEEAVADDETLLKAYDEAAFSIVVDPVDGTANFAAGLPLFATMAAVVKNGETIAGIIYDPMGDDWVLAEKGSGAWLKRPDGGAERLAVAAPPSLNEVVGTVSIAFLPGDRRQILSNLGKLRLAANYRVAGHDYRLLSGGHTHFAAFYKLMPWDHLAGSLIVSEAGGYVARYDGSAYAPTHRTGGLLNAASKDLWDELRREVFTF